MRFPLLADSKSCVGCLACVDACRADALKNEKRADGHIYVTIDKLKCVGCLKCERICSGVQHDRYGCNKKTSTPLAAYTTDRHFYARSTSGGAFPSIASYFIRNGGVVYGAVYYDGMHVAHRRVDDTAGLAALQGSKYIQSDLSGVYRKIDMDLRKGLKVLFTGTGCQVAAVLSYFKNNKDKESLFTMDMVCGGVPSSLLIESFAQNTKGFNSIVSFRSKSKYVFTYRDTIGKEIVCGKALPLDGFKSSLTNRYSCYNCKYVGLHRRSDITIGDYWGDTSGRTRSICIVHSKRCMDMISKLGDLVIEPVDWGFAINNPRLVYGQAPFGDRFERRYLDRLFSRLKYQNIEKVYGSDVHKTDILWMAYKIYKYIRFMQYFKKIVRIAKSIIEQ